MPSDPIELARFLIGVTLHRAGATMISGRIVETEAYLADDPASHSYRGMTARNRSMFARAGLAYVYRIYGAYWCLNVSAGGEGEGAGVLVRALEPLTGVDAMARARPNVKERDLVRGPGRLCAALCIDGSFDGIDLCASRTLWLGARRAPADIGASARIGLSKASTEVLRYYERGSAFLSGTARLNV